MTVQELIDKLSMFPRDMEVWHQSRGGVIDEVDIVDTEEVRGQLVVYLP